MPETKKTAPKQALCRAPVLENGQRIELVRLLCEMADAVSQEQKNSGGGKRKSRLRGERGRHRGYTLSGRLSEDKLDVVATLRAAALHCGVDNTAWKTGGAACERGWDRDPQAGQACARQGGNAPRAVEIRQSDLRYARLIFRERTRVLFVVDASRSQGARKRLAFAKGAILSLLRQIYYRRDYAGLVIFGDCRAQLALPFTRSVEYAAKRLQDLPAAGNTPLGMGLRKALEVASDAGEGAENVLLVVITDGKANYDEKEGNPFSLAMEAAGRIRELKIPAVLIDTERSAFNLGLAKKLAEKMGARYLLME